MRVSPAQVCAAFYTEEEAYMVFSPSTEEVSFWTDGSEAGGGLFLAKQ